MAVLMIRCPLTAQPISTGIEVETEAGFRSLPSVAYKIHCPACGNDHAWSKSDAWMTDSPEPLRDPNDPRLFQLLE